MQANQVTIVGAGGHGRELVAIARAASVAVAGVADDGVIDEALLDAIDVPFLGTTADAIRHGCPYLVGIGDPKQRLAVDERLRDAGLDAAVPLRHPSAVVGPDVEIGAGSVLFPLASLTTNVRLGRHVHVSTGASVAHDVRIADGTSIYPGARVSGAVAIGRGCLVGTKAAILPGTRLGDGCVVGAGATVIDDVADGSTVIGTPARPR